jgi:hypothetical protein
VTYAPSAIIGGLISLSGIIMGNVAISKTMGAYDASVSTRIGKQELFLTGEVANSGNKRAVADKWYRSTYPNGPLTKMLRVGQAVTVAGFIVMFALLAI